ncbi:UNVERIFIED_ORG: hypothetical protein M2312_003671, partial [Rhizobium esperanzae]|nr:hypothetical protein [Rhizobium esperanzae]
LVPIQCLQRIAHHQGESFAIITVKAKLAPMGLDPRTHAGLADCGDGFQAQGLE